MIVAGESTCMVTTSTPWLMSELVVSASLARSPQAKVYATMVSALGLTDFAPSSNALMKVEVQPNGKAATKPSLFDLVILPAAWPIKYQPSGGLPKKLAKFGPISQPPACSNLTSGYFFESSSAGYWWLKAVAKISF